MKTKVFLYHLAKLRYNDRLKIKKRPDYIFKRADFEKYSILLWSVPIQNVKYLALFKHYKALRLMIKMYKK